MSSIPGFETALDIIGPISTSNSKFSSLLIDDKVLYLLQNCQHLVMSYVLGREDL